MSIRVMFAYPVSANIQIIKPKVCPILIEQTIPWEHIERDHFIGVKRALEYIAPSAYPLVRNEPEFKEYFDNAGRLYRKILFTCKKPRYESFIEYLKKLHIETPDSYFSVHNV